MERFYRLLRPRLCCCCIFVLRRSFVGAINVLLLLSSVDNPLTPDFLSL